MKLLTASAVLLALTSHLMAAEPAWKPAEGPLATRWAKDVSPEKALPEYPRPQMVRKDWLNLNGLWQFSKAEKDEQPPVGKDLSEKILVPYPVESALSGVMRHEERMWYRRTFNVPKEWSGRHVLLHFDAVDWEAAVYINGTRLAVHRGGYDAFGFDITKFLKSDGPQEVIVGVFDPTDAGQQPRGKQVRKPGGIFYTPVSGIWQTVWIEPVSPAFIEGLKLLPDVDDSSIQVSVNALGSAKEKKGLTVAVTISDGGKEIGQVEGPAAQALKVKVPDAKLWTPEQPHLYDLRVQLRRGNETIDDATSYFAMRKVSLGKDDKGLTRILLNNQFVFQVGPLDQGFWPDGIYTAPTDEALRYDIEATKKLGFNMTRKHVKVEPERWYYWADKLGLLVWQDMPAGDNKGPGADEQFEHELRRMVEGRSNHPSIIMWVVFNEGWGEHDVPRLTKMVKDLDPSRLVSNASGWTDQKVGDIFDMHHYPDPAMPTPEPTRAAVLGEFGGLGLALDGHTWQKEHWGYRGVSGPDQLTASYERMLSHAWQLKDQGLNAVVYTQITDVETECNGLITYDRAVFKLDPDRGAKANSGHGPVERAVVATSQHEPARWHYTTDKPADGWMKAEFDDAAWKQGEAGFGTPKTPGAVVKTTWDTSDIWLRREVTLPDGKLANPSLLLHHDDDAEVYINGVLAAKAKGYTTDYQDTPISPEALQALKPGKNVIAIHCHQNAGGQYIDVGITDLAEGK